MEVINLQNILYFKFGEFYGFNGNWEIDEVWEVSKILFQWIDKYTDKKREKRKVSENLNNHKSELNKFMPVCIIFT